MASLATIVNRFVGVRAIEGLPAAVWTRTEAPRLRPIANEDVYLFVKRIDNSGVIRAADPVARTARSRSVATGFLAAMLVIAGLAPAAYNTMAGFQLQNLRKEQDVLKQQQATLDLQEAELSEPGPARSARQEPQAGGAGSRSPCNIWTARRARIATRGISCPPSARLK